MEDKKRTREIRAVEDKYGILIFRMGLTHIMDVGIRHLNKKYIDESIKLITEEGKENEENGVTTVMSPEFQCEIIYCAAELSQFTIWQLFSYIKNHVDIS